MSNQTFKLIAIRPLHECHSKFLKNLNEGCIYKFYNDFCFKDKNQKEILDSNYNLNKDVEFISTDIKTPSYLYESYFNNDIEISVSALVGKNGSGKSTIIELFYASCYILSKLKKIKELENKKKDANNNDFLNTYLPELNEGNLSNEEKFLFNEFEQVKKHLKVELFFQKGDNYFCLTISENTKHIKIINDKKNCFSKSEEKKEDFLKNLFYTISINYSLYGLNSQSMDSWIHGLFHKNDGYQTPLVITPYRHEGNINVNSELHLSQTRLLSNLLRTQSNEIINGKKIESLSLTLDINRINKYDEKIKKDLYSNIIGDYNYTDEDDMFEIFLNHKGLNYKTFFLETYKILYNYEITEELNLYQTFDFKILCKYVYHKILKISEKYYTSIINRINISFSFFHFLKTIREDKSHITLKLRQTLNTIRFDIINPLFYYESIDDIKSLDNKNLLEYKINFENLKEIIANIKELKQEELIPIGCFSAIIKIRNGETKNTISNLDILSSGEQHFIQSIQSIIYHIINVNSVFERNSEIQYEYINVILDEIELYFHPEFQRIFLDELLLCISKLKIPNIKGINFLFSTHSPFILSDIPKENTLKIENGNIKKSIEGNDNNTLGANIHDLLDNEFYLENGFMGEFTRKKVNSLIDYLSFNDTNSDVENWNDKDILQFINLIGEPLLKGTLRDLYFENNTSKTDEEIDAEIERLTNLKNRN